MAILVGCWQFASLILSLNMPLPSKMWQIKSYWPKGYLDWQSPGGLLFKQRSHVCITMWLCPFARGPHCFGFWQRFCLKLAGGKKKRAIKSSWMVLLPKHTPSSILEFGALIESLFETIAQKGGPPSHLPGICSLFEPVFSSLCECFATKHKS